MASVMDPEENLSTFKYDGLGREINRTLANGNTILREYDKDGNLLNIVNKNSHGVLSSFDYQYDKNGNKLSQVEEDGATTSYKYDSLNRLIEVTYPIDKIKAVLNAVDTPNDKINTNENKTSYKKDSDSVVKLAMATTDIPLISVQPSEQPATPSPSQGNGNANQGNGNDQNSSAQGNSQNATGQDNDNNGNQNNENQGNGQDKGNKDKENNGKNGEKGNKGKNKKSPLGCGPDGTMEMDTSIISDLPDYLIQPQSKVQYRYDAAGNRLSMTTDEGTTQYSYNAMNQLVNDGEAHY